MESYNRWVNSGQTISRVDVTCKIDESETKKGGLIDDRFQKNVQIDGQSDDPAPELTREFEWYLVFFMEFVHYNPLGSITYRQHFIW